MPLWVYDGTQEHIGALSAALLGCGMYKGHV